MPARERFAASDEVWVCAACGRIGRDNDRHHMGDTSCVLYAVRCHRVKVDGKWVPVELSALE